MALGKNEVSRLLKAGSMCRAEAIIAYAEQEGSQFLVVGHNNGTSDRLGLGGTADQVSSHAPCTVVIVK